MKAIQSLTVVNRRVLLLVGLATIGCGASAQEKIAAEVLHKQTLDKIGVVPAGAPLSTVTSRDTVECLFHQMVNNSRPLLTWRRGYIVLENGQIRTGDMYYPKSQASALTGLIQNQFLASNKKKPVSKKVVQVVLLD